MRHHQCPGPGQWCILNLKCSLEGYVAFVLPLNELSYWNYLWEFILIVLRDWGLFCSQQAYHTLVDEEAESEQQNQYFDESLDKTVLALGGLLLVWRHGFTELVIWAVWCYRHNICSAPILRGSNPHATLWHSNCEIPYRTFKLIKSWFSYIIFWVLIILFILILLLWQNT